MFFLMTCEHHPNKDAARDEHRPKHREWVRSGGDGVAVVLVGSATLNDDGTTRGNFGILEAESLEKAMAFAEGDPFAKAGIVKVISMTPLPDTFQAHRISDPMTVRQG
ncbi:YciI family protein [Rhizobium sp. L1K21]|uniref:YciI family protein n=1 Tax=Rhizobium sp. L1K21 TaxID=2954933 RepID=UPI002092BE84|nr:YciI family protein [Rhizobium sp. L1K21]MCO6187242.1 YciI family protein [Rhizobium sp. L1K21]